MWLEGIEYQVRVVKLQLSGEKRNGLKRVSEGRVLVELKSGDVNDEQKEASPFNVFQEPMAHADVVAGTLDEAYQEKKLSQIILAFSLLT